jgi:outer membrane protein assembly factor BamD (BamD/ComL family)
LLTELNLLKQARAAVRSGEHQTALTLLDRHATELHRTELTTEATLLRIEALAALGRHGEASNLARRFVAENPNSPLVDRAQHFIDQPNRDGSR